MKIAIKTEAIIIHPSKDTNIQLYPYPNPAIPKKATAINKIKRIEIIKNNLVKREYLPTSFSSRPRNSNSVSGGLVLYYVLHLKVFKYFYLQVFKKIHQFFKRSTPVRKHIFLLSLHLAKCSCFSIWDEYGVITKTMIAHCPQG